MIAPGLPATCCISLLKHSRAEPDTPTLSLRHHEQFSVRPGHQARDSCDAADRVSSMQSGQARSRVKRRRYLPQADSARPGVRCQVDVFLFADAPGRYGKSSTPRAFVGRACVYTCLYPCLPARALLRAVPAHPHEKGQSQPRAGDPYLALPRVPSADATSAIGPAVVSTHRLPFRIRARGATRSGLRHAVLITPDQPGR
jgi:hypothetical protein